MFDDCLTIEQIDRRKRSLVAELHPDVGGSNERFLAMMDAYNKAVDRITNPAKEESQPPTPNPEPIPNYGYTHPQQPFYVPTMQDRMENVLTFITQGADLVAKAAVVYTTVMDQLDAIKAEKRKKARRKPRKRLS